MADKAVDESDGMYETMLDGQGGHDEETVKGRHSLRTLSMHQHTVPTASSLSSMPTEGLPAHFVSGAKARDWEDDIFSLPAPLPEMKPEVLRALHGMQDIQAADAHVADVFRRAQLVKQQQADLIGTLGTPAPMEKLIQAAPPPSPLVMDGNVGLDEVYDGDVDGMGCEMRPWTQTTVLGDFDHPLAGQVPETTNPLYDPTYEPGPYYGNIPQAPLPRAHTHGAYYDDYPQSAPPQMIDHGSFMPPQQTPHFGMYGQQYHAQGISGGSYSQAPPAEMLAPGSFMLLQPAPYFSTHGQQNHPQGVYDTSYLQAPLAEMLASGSFMACQEPPRFGMYGQQDHAQEVHEGSYSQAPPAEMLAPGSFMPTQQPAYVGAYGQPDHAQDIHEGGYLQAPLTGMFGPGSFMPPQQPPYFGMAAPLQPLPVPLPSGAMLHPSLLHQYQTAMSDPWNAQQGLCISPEQYMAREANRAMDWQLFEPLPHAPQQPTEDVTYQDDPALPWQPSAQALATAMAFVRAFNVRFDGDMHALASFEALYRGLKAGNFSVEDFYTKMYRILYRGDSLDLLPQLVWCMPVTWREADLSGLNRAVELQVDEQEGIKRVEGEKMKAERSKAPRKKRAPTQDHKAKEPLVRPAMGTEVPTWEESSDEPARQIKTADKPRFEELKPSLRIRIGKKKKASVLQLADDAVDETSPIQSAALNKSMPSMPLFDIEPSKRATPASSSSLSDMDSPSPVLAHIPIERKRKAAPQVSSSVPAGSDKGGAPKRRKVARGHQPGSQVAHVGPVYASRRAVLARADKPYVHGLCGMGLAHPQDVKTHHKVCTKERRGAGAVVAWDAHESCTVGYPDLNYAKVLDGYVILDRESWDLIEDAVEKGRQFLREKEEEEEELEVSE